MFPDDVVAQGQAEAGPGAGGLGGVVRLEDVLDLLSGHAHTRVSEDDLDGAVVPRCTKLLDKNRSARQYALLGGMCYEQGKL